MRTCLLSFGNAGGWVLVTAANAIQLGVRRPDFLGLSFRGTTCQPFLELPPVPPERHLPNFPIDLSRRTPGRSRILDSWEGGPQAAPLDCCTTRVVQQGAS